MFHVFTLGLHTCTEIWNRETPSHIWENVRGLGKITIPGPLGWIRGKRGHPLPHLPKWRHICPHTLRSSDPWGEFVESEVPPLLMTWDSGNIYNEDERSARDKKDMKQSFLFSLARKFFQVPGIWRNNEENNYEKIWRIIIRRKSSYFPHISSYSPNVFSYFPHISSYFLLFSSDFSNISSYFPHISSYPEPIHGRELRIFLLSHLEEFLHVSFILSSSLIYGLRDLDKIRATSILSIDMKHVSIAGTWTGILSLWLPTQYPKGKPPEQQMRFITWYSTL